MQGCSFSIREFALLRYNYRLLLISFSNTIEGGYIATHCLHAGNAWGPSFYTILSPVDCMVKCQSEDSSITFPVISSAQSTLLASSLWSCDFLETCILCWT